MKIALIGYGKMGHIIENIAKEREHEIVCIIDQHNLEDFGSEAFRSADVAIEFTIPTSAEGNVLKCFEAGVPVVRHHSLERPPFCNERDLRRRERDAPLGIQFLSGSEYLQGSEPLSDAPDERFPSIHPPYGGDSSYP